MPHPVHAHYTDGVGDFVNYPVIAYADAPIVFTAGQFAAA